MRIPLFVTRCSQKKSCRGVYEKAMLDGDASSGIRSTKMTEGEVESWQSIVLDAA